MIGSVCLGGVTSTRTNAAVTRYEERIMAPKREKQAKATDERANTLTASAVPRLRRNIDIFISSPSDVQKERRAAERVISRLNRQPMVANRFVLRTLMYERDVPSRMGPSAQEVINEHIRADRADVVICILWHRMGTPTDDPATGQHYQSGTEYEFETAYEAQVHSGKPFIMLYKCTRPIPQEGDPEQWMRVRNFFQRIERQGLYKPYRTVAEFEDLLRADLELYLGRLAQNQAPFPSTSTTNIPVPATPNVHAIREDLRDFPQVQRLCGRKNELADIQRWILNDRCRVVALLGTGGAGKTTLAARVVENIKNQFDYVLWRRLISEPHIDEIVRDCIQLFSNQQVTEIPTGLESQLTLLTRYFSAHRCLLVLDNLETILQPGTHAGRFRPGFESYGQLIRRVGEVAHTSCLLLTSREIPDEVGRSAGRESPVRALSLPALTASEGRQLLQDRGLTGSRQDWEKYVSLYSGNPLQLKIASERVQRTFGGSVPGFLAVEGGIVSSGIHALLEEQCDRLSELEIDLMYWLAIEREAVTLEDLQAKSTRHDSAKEVLEAIDSLNRRSLIEIGGTAQFFLQPVILEYLTERLVHTIVDDMRNEQVGLLGSHSLMQAKARDYVRIAQIRRIVAPVAERMCQELGREGFGRLLKRTLRRLQHLRNNVPRYAAGNILNLLVQQDYDLHRWDFSHLPVWQADLSSAEFQDVTFAGADLRQCTFADTFEIILSVAFSPVDDLLAAGTASGEIRLWKISDGSPITIYRGHTDFVWSIAFSSDGTQLVSGSEDKTVRIWNVKSGRLIHTLRDHAACIRAVAFSPDCSLVATAGADNFVRLWVAETGQPYGVPFEHPHWIKALAFSPDGRLLATGGDSQYVHIWDLSTNLLARTLESDASRVRALSFSCNSSQVRLVTGGDDSMVRVWDTKSGVLLHKMSGHTSWIRSLACSADGQFIVSGGDDRTARVWDLSSGTLKRTFSEHTNWIWCVAVGPDSRTVATSGDDQTARLWDIQSGDTLHTLRGHNGRVMAIAISSKGNHLTSGGEDAIIRVWDEGGALVERLVGHTNRIRALAFSTDGELIASGGDERVVRIWMSKTGRVHSVLEQPDWIKSVIFSPDGDLLATAGDDSVIRLWRVATQQMIRELLDHSGRVWAAAISPKGDLLASGGDDRCVRLWNLRSGSLEAILHGHENRVRALAFSPDGAYLVSGSEDRTINVWDVSTSTLHKTLRGHSGRIRSVAVAPDTAIIASASEDQTIRLWSLHTGDNMATLHGHSHMVWCVAFNSDGTVVGSGSEDSTVKLWDTRSCQCIRTLRPERPYERMNITQTTGLTDAQRMVLIALGAIEFGQ